MANPQLIEETFITGPLQFLTLEDGFRFSHGQTIAPFTIAYETFGELNEERSNAILVCHALSPSAHVAGKYNAADEKPGWWDGLVGYGKGIDLSKYFVVCVNIPGSCNGTNRLRTAVTSRTVSRMVSTSFVMLAARSPQIL